MEQGHETPREPAPADLPAELLSALCEDVRAAARRLREKRAERVIDHAVWETFPASDPISATSVTEGPEVPPEAETLPIAGSSGETPAAPVSAETCRYQFELDGVPLEMEVKVVRREA